MRQKVRRLSKSALSVLLSIVMVAVGVVNVSAFTFTTNHKIYFDATKWSNRTKVYVNFLSSDQNSGNLQEMTQIGTTGIYRYENNSVSGSNYGVMFVLNNGWNTAGQWNSNNSKSNLSQYATNCTDSYGLDLEKDHVYYFRASGSNKNDGVIKDHDYNGTSYTIDNGTVRNTDRIWSFNLTATSSVATTPTGMPSTGNASSTAGGKVAVNASYFNGWDSVSSAGPSTASSTSSTYYSAAKGSVATWTVNQVYPGYVFDGWYSDETSTGETNRLSTNQNYSETITGGLNGSITRYAHFHRGQATITTAVSPSGAGTAQVSTSQSVTYETSVTVQSDTTVYLKAESTNRYEFSEWKAVSGLTFTDRTSATTSATATATATATAVFLPINYNLTKQNPPHAKIKIPNQARWGETVTPTATTDVGYKISKYKYSTDGGSTWTDVTPGSGFIMPEDNVVVSAEETECTAYTVTMTPNGNGSISARTADGQTISSGAQVNEGTVITFTAVPADQAFFTNWGGDLSGSVSPTTLTVNANKNVIATFGDNTYFVASYTSSTYNANAEAYSTVTMSRLNNGYYRSSTKLSNNKFFTVGKTAGSTTTYAKCGQDEPWGISNVTPAVTPQHWTSNKTMKSKYQNTIGEDSYVFYDPETDKIWLSSDPAGFTGVTIFAKDGSLASPSPGTGTAPGTTCGWGNTTLTVTAGGSDITVTNDFNDQVHKATLTDAEVQASTTSVTVSTTSSKSGYYVYGFDVNGITIQAENGSATFCPADLDCNISNFIEITPIYMLTDSNPNNPTTIRFYVRSFAGEIESRWGGALYCYSYNDSREATNGLWPGQPMVNLGGGTYYMDLPLDTRAITLSNAAADWVHATTMGIALPTSGKNWEQTSWDNRNAYQCQSYDYDDFQYIYAKPGVGENDEDIIFDFKYKHGDWGTAGKDNFPNNQFEYNNGYYSETGFPETLDPSDSSYQWEEYTDFYGNPVDLWGTRLTSNYNNNPVRVVVQGYYDTSAANSSYYATTYVVYKPSSTTGNCTYSIVNYTDSAGYGKKSRSEFLQRSAEDMGLAELAGQPVEITYEYAIYKNRSTKNTNEPGQLNQYAERADGVWYYSETKPVKAKIKIQYADKLYGAYTDDTFEIDTENSGTDYDGDPYTVNEGTVTKGKAYFIDNNVNNANRPSGAPFNVNYTNRTVEFAYSDGNEHYELQAEESPDGEYTFVGWYKETSNGLDKCPPGFTYRMEATTNETFIARYVKAPSGIKLAHKPVVNGKGGNGNREVKYEIYDNPNLTGRPLKTGEANGSIVVDKKYIKYNQNYYLKVTYEVVPDGNSLPNGIYSTDEQAPGNLISEAGFEAHNTYNSKHVDVDNFALTPEGTATTNTTKVEFKVPINAFFKQITGTNDYEFDEDLALLELFSDIDRKRNNINITKTVDYNNGETFSFTVKAFNDHGTPDDFTDDRWDDYAGKYTVGDDPTEHSFTGTISNVSGGQTIHIVGAPAGTVFQISEVDPATDTAYNFTSVTIDGATATDDIPKGKQFTMPNNGSVDMKFTNNIKKADVKVKKVVVDGNSGTQKFPITATIQIPGGSSQRIQPLNLAHNGERSLGDLPVGTTISISEGNTTGYQLVGVTCDGTYVQTNASAFKVAAESSGTNTGLITVTNKKLHDVTITKDVSNDLTTDWGDYTHFFPIKIETSTDNGSTWTQVTTSLPCVDYKENATNDDNCITYGNITVHAIRQGDKLTLSNLETGTLVKVTELTTNPVDPVAYSEQYSNFNSKFSIAQNNYDLIGVAAKTQKTQETTPVDVAATNGGFAVPDKNMDITVTNSVKLVNLYVQKQFSDFNYDDDSTFVFEVIYKPLGANSPDYLLLTNGVKDPNDTTNYLSHTADKNVYTVKKNSRILFANIPMGSYVKVIETAIGTSTLVGGERFTYDYASLASASSTHIDNGHSFVVNTNDTLTVYNKVKKSVVDITKAITSPNNNDTKATHRIKVKIQENGSSSTPLTSIEYKLNETYSAATPAVTPTSVSCDGEGFATINIHAQDHLYFRYPIGSYFTVQELDDSGTNNYRLSNITVTNAADSPAPSSAGSNPFEFQTKDANATVTITNSILTKNLTITKTTNVTNTSDEFKIKLYTSTDNTNWAPYTTALKIASGSSTLAPSNSEYTIHKGEQWVMQNIPINTYVKIEESDCNTTAGYTFDGMTGDGVTVDTTNRTGVVQMTADKTVTITNKEDIKYQFEITYIYESYSAKTYKDNMAHNDDNRVVGGNRSYTQTGEISREDLNTYFNKESDGSLSIKSDKRKEFINKFAPYEDDFMLNLVWDDSDPKPATYYADKKTIKLETTATSDPHRTVNVYFKLPYDVNNETLEPSADAPAKKDAVQHDMTTQYGNWVTTNRVYNDEEAADFVTAPLTLSNGEKFQYWQITSAKTTKRDTAVDSKRCYYDQFNMTMYQDCYVEPVYEASPADFDPSARSLADTQNGEARISFIENSRNQWNNKGGGSDMTGDRLQAGDRIYSDFLLTFGYRDRLLNSANNGGVEAAGFVLEQVAELDKEGDKYVTKSASEYAAAYDDTVNKEKVKNYLNNEDQTVDGFVNKSTINLSGLDNKNQTKYSFSIKNKAYGDLAEGTAKNFVYRAYSYLKVGSNIVVSDPVYFTIYDMASIELGQTDAQGGQS